MVVITKPIQLFRKGQGRDDRRKHLKIRGGTICDCLAVREQQTTSIAISLINLVQFVTILQFEGCVPSSPYLRRTSVLDFCCCVLMQVGSMTQLCLCVYMDEPMAPHFPWVAAGCATSTSAPKCPETSLQAGCRTTVDAVNNVLTWRDSSATQIGHKSSTAAAERAWSAEGKCQRGSTGLSQSLRVCARKGVLYAAQMDGPTKMFARWEKPPAIFTQHLSSLEEGPATLVTAFFSHICYQSRRVNIFKIAMHMYSCLARGPSTEPCSPPFPLLQLPVSSKALETCLTTPGLTWCLAVRSQPSLFQTWAGRRRAVTTSCQEMILASLSRFDESFSYASLKVSLTVYVLIKLCPAGSASPDFTYEVRLIHHEEYC